MLVAVSPVTLTPVFQYQMSALMGGITIDMGLDSNSNSVLNNREILKIQAMYKVSDRSDGANGYSSQQVNRV